MVEERLTGLESISIENYLDHEIKHEEAINQFMQKTSRKNCFLKY